MYGTWKTVLFISGLLLYFILCIPVISTADFIFSKGNLG